MANVEHSALTDPELHEPKGISTAAANQVYVADGAASGAFAQVSPSNIVMVHSASDLPTAAATVRTLAANTIYHVVGAVSIGADTLVMGANTVLRGSQRNIDSIVSTTVGSLITATSVSCTMQDITFTCSSGTWITQTGAGTEIITCDHVVVSSTTLGSFSTGFAFNTLLSVFTGSTAGFTFVGAFNQLLIQSSRVTVSTTANICFDLGTATFNFIVFDTSDFQNAAGVTGIDIAAAGANLNAGKLGHIHNCFFLTAATATNYVAGDIKWIVGGTPSVGSSAAVAQGYIVDSALSTAFSGTGAGNEVIVNFGTAWLDTLSNKFTVSTAGVYTYAGVTDIDVYVTSNIYASIAGGASRTYNFYWRKNSTTDLSSVSQRDYDGTNSGSLSCGTVASLTNGDTLALYVRAETATTAMVVDTCSIKIIQVGN